MSFWSALIGVPQSKYAGIAIIVSLFAVALAVLLGKEAVPLSQKFIMVLAMIVLSLPAIFLTLVEVTCLVTGAGMKNQRLWCSLYAWILSGLIILYSVLLIIFAILSLTGDEQARVAENFGVQMAGAKKAVAEYFNAETDATEELPPVQEPAVEVTSPPEASAATHDATAEDAPEDIEGVSEGFTDNFAAY